MSESKITLPSAIASVDIRVSVSDRHVREISAALTVSGSGGMLAYIGFALADDCHVRIDGRGRASLWIGRSALDLPEQDAQRAANALEIRLIDERVKGDGA